MGYDLYVKNPPAEAVAAAEAARREFEEAVNLRNSMERDTPEYNTVQERIEGLFEAMNPADMYYRYNIWGMSTMRRIMAEAGVDEKVLNKFNSNDGYVVTPTQCRKAAQQLRDFATLDADGAFRMFSALSKGDISTGFERAVTGMFMGGAAEQVLGEDAGDTVVKAPLILKDVPSPERLAGMIERGELDDMPEHTREGIQQAMYWLHETPRFADFMERAAEGGGFEVC